MYVIFLKSAKKIETHAFFRWRKINCETALFILLHFLTASLLRK